MNHPPGSFLLAGVRLTVASLEVALPGAPVRFIASDTAGRGAVGSSPNAAISALLDLRDRVWVVTALGAAIEVLRGGLDKPDRLPQIASTVARYLDAMRDPRVMRVIGRLDDAEEVGLVAMQDAALHAIEVLGVVRREAEETYEEGAALAA